PPQGTFTPLDHTHAGRTQPDWSGLAKLVGVVQRLSAAAQSERYADYVAVSMSSGIQAVLTQIDVRRSRTNPSSFWRKKS
ncbi:hypothetical protein ACKFKF_17990, partial [Phormidesmis sp. 146-12]